MLVLVFLGSLDVLFVPEYLGLEILSFSAFLGTVLSEYYKLGNNYSLRMQDM